MVSLIIELVYNRSFILTTRTGKQSRLRHPKNGVQQDSVIASLLFTNYAYDLPAYDLHVTFGRKFACDDDLAVLHYAGDWQSLEGTLTQDMATLSSYLYKWKLKLFTAKTASARRELNIFVNEQALPFCAEPTYLGIKLDRALTFRRHLE